MIAFLLLTFFALIIFGVPIAMSLGLASIGGLLFIDHTNLLTVCQRMFAGMNSFALLAIPLYTFAGFTMSKGGISKRLMDFCYSIVGKIPGGLGHVNILASMVFAGISGSAVADTAGVSGMIMPQMVDKGYSKEESVAVTAVSSTIGIIIPPVHPHGGHRRHRGHLHRQAVFGRHHPRHNAGHCPDDSLLLPRQKRQGAQGRGQIRL
jgi:TRAP-type C4-dicarboxylate transport system, large permease component